MCITVICNKCILEFVDGIEGMLWWTTKTLNILWYLPQSMQAGFTPKNIEIVVRINELKSSFWAMSSHYF